MKTVEEFLASLTREQRATIDLLRQIISGASAGVTEHLKWNAPSFCLNGDDRVTLGLERDGTVRMVLHRGAKPKDVTGFKFDDSAGLAKWPAPDRGVLQFQDARDVESRRAEVGEGRETPSARSTRRCEVAKRGDGR
ncbi:MAG: DUF1801 domain-containing protein [Deltaproteobacteria bacterium]|nr:DUF1801 domain-containing protein [Deltaproteobacteria bacterium]